MKTALIGHTGFVGSNLLEQGNFTHTYNSKNISEIANESFDEIWCSGISAVKWWANQNPEEDWKNIKSLLDILKTVKTKKFILISTVDVFQNPFNVDESKIPSRENLHAYGLHRLKVEDFISENFENTSIIRLPGLFGKGLKKNIIYDFMNNNEIEKIDSKNIFQFYDLSTIYSDCKIVLENNLKLAHFATEPVSVKEVAQAILTKDFENSINPNIIHYNMSTQYAKLWGKESSYIKTKEEILLQIQKFSKNR